MEDADRSAGPVGWSPAAVTGRRWRTLAWSTSIVDVKAGQLLDLIEGRSSTGACEWLAGRDQDWLDAIRWAVLDLSGPWRLAFNTMLPAAVQVADPFHLVKLANSREVDPVEGGSANDYDYTNADPVNSTDLDGEWPSCNRCRTRYNSIERGARSIKNGCYFGRRTGRQSCRGASAFRRGSAIVVSFACGGRLSKSCRRTACIFIRGALPGTYIERAWHNSWKFTSRCGWFWSKSRHQKVKQPYCRNFRPFSP